MAAAVGSDGATRRRAVKRLSFGRSWEDKEGAAAEVGTLARSDERTKQALPELGVVSTLLSMLLNAGGQGGAGARTAAVRALLELARGMHRCTTLCDPKFSEKMCTPRAATVLHHMNRF